MEAFSLSLTNNEAMRQEHSRIGINTVLGREDYSELRVKDFPE